MALVIWIVLGVALNLFLAMQTAKDAHRRGHEESSWAALVVVTGLLGVAVYLLNRNDRKLPPSEREPRPSLSLFPLVYPTSATVGMIGLGLLTHSALGEGPIMRFAALLGLIVPPAMIYGMRR